MKISINFIVCGFKIALYWLEISPYSESQIHDKYVKEKDQR